MYAIYHKFAGYLKDDNNYTNEIKNALLFETKEDAEIEIDGYLEKVEKIETQN